jgi:hypothetical protein
LSDPRVEALNAIMERVHIAALTIEAHPGDGPKGFFTTWPAYRHIWWDEGNELSKRSDADIARRFLAPPRFYPTARQIDDCLPALALLDGFAPSSGASAGQARRIINRRAHQLWYGEHGGWLAIGADCGVSHTTARKIHWSAMVYALDASLKRSAKLAFSAA